MEWAAELGLNTINVGDTRTFERGNTKSYIDITWATDEVTEWIKKWEALNGEFFTLHNHIYFEITHRTVCYRRTKRVHRFLDKDRFVTKLKDHFLSREEKMSLSQFIEKLNEINSEYTISIEERRNVPYWWN